MNDPFISSKIFIYKKKMLFFVLFSMSSTENHRLMSFSSNDSHNGKRRVTKIKIEKKNVEQAHVHCKLTSEWIGTMKIICYGNQSILCEWLRWIFYISFSNKFVSDSIWFLIWSLQRVQRKKWFEYRVARHAILNIIYCRAPNTTKKICHDIRENVWTKKRRCKATWMWARKKHTQ